MHGMGNVWAQWKNKIDMNTYWKVNAQNRKCGCDT